MDREDQLAIFKAQVTNVKELEKAWKHLQRTINRELIKENHTSAKLHTKMLALVFCAWSGANFSKLIHTPHGFDLDEIDQIKKETKSNIVHGWDKCLTLGLRHINSSTKSNYLPNIQQKVSSLIKKYIQNPSLIRNKIAHGQWIKALNRDNTAINLDLTSTIEKIDVVVLNIWKESYKGLANIIEALIESPDRAFRRDYWKEIVELEQFLKDTSSWTLADKIRLLQRKKPRNKESTPKNN